MPVRHDRRKRTDPQASGLFSIVFGGQLGEFDEPLRLRSASEIAATPRA